VVSNYANPVTPTVSDEMIMAAYAALDETGFFISSNAEAAMTHPVGTPMTDIIAAVSPLIEAEVRRRIVAEIVAKSKQDWPDPAGPADEFKLDGVLAGLSIAAKVARGES
jgi:hypothetical protein